MKKYSVLYILGGRSFGSNIPGRKISEVINTWREIGVDVFSVFGRDFISGDVKSEYGNQSHFDNKFVNKPYLKFLKHSVSEFRDIVHDRMVYKHILAEDIKVDLVWERSSRLHFSGLKLAKKKGVPFVLEWKDHLVDYRFSLFKWYALYIEKRKLKNADFIVVESTVLKNDLVRQGVLPNKVFVSLNAVNPNEFVRDPKIGVDFLEKYNISPNHKVVGYLGSYAFYHNTILLVETAALVLKEFKEVTFLLVGNGKDYKMCRDRAIELGILNSGLIMLDGVPKEDVPWILSSVDFSVLPGSTDIICPIKIMEYMAAETLVFAPDYLCNREVLSSSTGILFEPDNVDDLKSKLLDALYNPSKYSEIPAESRKYVENNLTWENTWGRTLLNILNGEENI